MPVVSSLAGAGQSAFIAGLVETLGFEAVPPEALRPHLEAGEPVIVNGWWTPGPYDALIDQFPGLIHVCWHSGWTGSDVMGEGKTLAQALDHARAGRIKLLWLERRDAPPPGAHPMAPVWSRRGIESLVGEPPPAKVPGSIMVAVHGQWPSAAKNILANLAACTQVAREMPGIHLHVGEKTLGEPTRGGPARELLRGVSHTLHPVLSRADTARLAASCDVLVHASVSEVWPFLPMEAIYAGTPAIISDAVPWADLLPADVQALCVARPAKASGKIAGLVRQLMQDPDARRLVLDAQRDLLDRLAPESVGEARAALANLGFFDSAPNTDLRDQITAFVITSGEPSTAQSIAAVERQDVRVTIDVVRNVAPMHLAFQQMLDRCSTPYFVQVDADMILEPDAIRRLYSVIRKAPANVALRVDWLWGDFEQRPIQGVKIYRHDLCARHPYRDSLSCEMDQTERMKADGLITAAAPEPPSRSETLGLHHACQTTEMAFRRWKRLMHKYRAAPWMGWLAPYPSRLKERWLASPGDRIAEAAYHGAIMGLAGPAAEPHEADFRQADQDFRRFARHAGEYSEGPREMTLYVTDRCNFRCEFDGNPCMRETGDKPGAGVPHNGQVVLDDVAAILDRFPSIRGVCIAGFGEPLLYPALEGLLDLLLGRQLIVGIVTNGSLLHGRTLEVLAYRPQVAYVSVSLNATTEAEHHEMSKTKTWNDVLGGIRALAQTDVRIGVSYVVTRHNYRRLPALFELVRTLGAKFIHLHNILPHAGTRDPNFRMSVLTHDCEEARAIDTMRHHPGAELVEVWPQTIDLKASPLKCMSPLISLGVDASGAVSGCRRVAPPEAGNGHVSTPGIWHDPHYSSLALALTGDRPLPDACAGCFGGVKG